MSSIGLYIHVPFCDAKCPYCAFYSVEYREDLATRYVAAVEKELDGLGETFPGRPIDTVYIGGGTPTILAADMVARLCRAIREHLPGRGVEEWTVEANPAGFDAEILQILVSAGVNRVSLGAQSFSDDALRVLGRRHSAQQVRDAVGLLNEHGIHNFGLDLIACVPGVDPASWRRTLDEAVSSGAKHVSVYALTFEEGTRLAAAAANGTLTALDDDAQLAHLHLAEEVMTRGGRARYEISNYAVPGMECRHNISCWRWEDYFGAGPAAASHDGVRRWTNTADVESYLSAIESGERAPRDEEKLCPEACGTEMLMLGLRTTTGIDVEQIAARARVDAGQKKKWLDRVDELSESKLVIREGTTGTWVLSARGRDLADYVGLQLTG